MNISSSLAEMWSSSRQQAEKASEIAWRPACLLSVCLEHLWTCGYQQLADEEPEVTLSPDIANLVGDFFDRVLT